MWLRTFFYTRVKTFTLCSFMSVMTHFEPANLNGYHGFIWTGFNSCLVIALLYVTGFKKTQEFTLCDHGFNALLLFGGWSISRQAGLLYYEAYPVWFAARCCCCQYWGDFKHITVFLTFACFPYWAYCSFIINDFWFV